MCQVKVGLAEENVYKFIRSKPKILLNNWIKTCKIWKIVWRAKKLAVQRSWCVLLFMICILDGREYIQLRSSQRRKCIILDSHLKCTCFCFKLNSKLSSVLVSHVMNCVFMIQKQNGKVKSASQMSHHTPKKQERLHQWSLCFSTFKLLCMRHLCFKDSKSIKLTTI